MNCIRKTTTTETRYEFSNDYRVDISNDKDVAIWEGNVLLTSMDKKQTIDLYSMLKQVLKDQKLIEEGK